MEAMSIKTQNRFKAPVSRKPLGISARMCPHGFHLSGGGFLFGGSMNGKTSKQRLARRAELANKPATPDKPLVPWMRTIDGNIEWLEVQIAISKLPGHAPRRMIEETINGVKTGRVSLARGI